jgi:hypothetical protein
MEMADNDITDLLANTFTGLQLFAAQRNEPLCCFDLFPELPIELRLKIFNAALPIPSVLDIQGKVIVSDPSFGLYITFSIPSIRPRTSKRGNPGRSLMPVHETRNPKQTRALSLLAATRESRDAYRSEYSIALPYDSGSQGGSRRGTLYVSKRELLHWDKLDNMVDENTDLRTAIVSDYRLQDFWGQIQNLALPIECFVLGERKGGLFNDTLRMILLKMTSLKNLKGVMWKGFYELKEGPAKEMMEQSMRSFMGVTEAALKGHGDEHEEYRMPKFELVA